MSHVDEVRVWCRHCCGTGKERFDRRNPCDCDECHGRGYTAVWPTDEQRNAALRERDLRAELAEARRERDEATGERAACMVLFGEYGIKWAEDLPHTVDVLCRRLCCVAIDNGRAERALASADVHAQWLRAERAEQSCLALERDAAEAMALVLNHEGHITKLEAELAEVVIERSEADSCRRKEAERADAAEAEVERLRAELEVDRKNGKDQWLWANDSDEPTYNHRRNDSLQTPCELCKARAEIVRLRARDGRLQAEVRRLIDMAEGNAKELDGPGGIVDKWRADERRADRAEAERDAAQGALRPCMTALGNEGAKRIVAVRAAKMWERRWAGVRRNIAALSAEVGALRIEVVEQDERLARYDQAATMWRESRPNERAEVLADLRAFGAERSPANYQRAADVLAALEVDRG